MATWLLSGNHFSRYQDTSEQDRHDISPLKQDSNCNRLGAFVGLF